MGRILTIFAMAVGLMAVPDAPEAEASTCGLSTMCFRDYYSDATHQNPVGAYYIYCGGIVQKWGRTTVHSTYVVRACP
jgi:hypothetical protein